MYIIDQSTVSHIHISHFLIYNPLSGYQYLTPVGEESTLILTYNPVSRLTNIPDQF